MSDLIATFDPALAASGTFKVRYLSNGIGTLVVHNDSARTLQLIFPDGNTDVAPAWLSSKFYVTGPGGDVTWKQHSTVNNQAPDLSQVDVVAYRKNEPVPGVYPAALTRQTKSGGGNVSSTSTLTLNNTGKAANTNIIFAEPTGDNSAGGAISADNAGTMTLGDATYGGFLTIQGPGSANIQMIQNLIQMVSATGNPDVTIEPGNTIVNGATSGTATMYEILRGPGLRVVIVLFNNFQNNSGAAQAQALLTSFNGSVLIWASNVPNLQLTLGGVAQTIQILTALAVGGGTITGTTNFKGHSLGEVGPVDTVSYSAGDGSAHTGMLLLIGS